MISMMIIASTLLLQVPATSIMEESSASFSAKTDDNTKQLHPSQHRNLIIGGHDAPENKYPYFATFDHFGGGILIAPDIILTAGHVHPPLEQNVQVRLNHSHFTSTNFAADPIDNQTYAITAIVQHPDYYMISWDENVHDYSLFVLDRCSTIPPVTLNRKSRIPQPGQMVTVVGMGSMSPNPTTFVETSATTLQEVALEVLSHHQCIEQSGDPQSRPQVSYKGRIFEECMFCTSGGTHNEKDACAFDSGSPLLVDDKYGDPLVVGLVSWGENCADPYFPAVNARVSYAMDWIDATVCALSKANPSQLAGFRCDEIDDDDDYYFRAAEFVRPIHDDYYYHHDGSKSSGRRRSSGGDSSSTSSSSNSRIAMSSNADSGLNAMMVLVAAGSLALALVVLRLQHYRHRRLRTRSLTLSSRRESMVEERLLTTHPAKAAIERVEDQHSSPDGSLKTYDTFSGQSI